MKKDIMASFLLRSEKASFNKHGQWSLDKDDTHTKQQYAISQNYKGKSAANAGKINTSTATPSKDETVKDILGRIKDKATDPQLSLPLSKKKS